MSPLRRAVKATAALLVAEVLVACTGPEADKNPELMTLAETEAWVDEMLALGRAASDIEDLAGAVRDVCQAKGYNPGTAEFRRCFDQMEARMVALAKAGALARLGDALKAAPKPLSPLIGLPPGAGDELNCYDRETKDIIGCQNI